MNKEDEYHWKVKRQLDCSPKLTFEQQIYREYLGLILRNHHKYVQIILNKKNSDTISIRSLMTPFGSNSVSNKEIRKKIFNWFKWFKKITENRELKIVEENDYQIVYM